MLKRLVGILALALVVAACTTPVLDLEVSSVTPEPDAIDVPVDVVVSATFNVAIDPDTVDGAFLLEPAAGGAPVAGTLSYNAATRTAGFTPAANLAYDTEYIASLAGTVATVGGVTLAGDLEWSFTTEAAPPVEDEIDGVSVTPETAELTVGESVQLTAAVSGVSGSPATTVTWSSDDDTVATVDADGLVTAVGVGTATITATSDFDGTFSDSAVITVVGVLEVVGDYPAYAAAADVNTAISIAFPTISGGLAPFAFDITAGALPADFVTQDATSPDVVGATYAVALDAGTGEIAGSTGFPGVFTGTVQVTDALGQTATAAFELDLELAFRYTDADLETTATTFSYPEFTGPDPYFIVPGNRVQVSGVANTDGLPIGFLADLGWALVYVSSNGSPDAGEIASFEINTLQGAITQVAGVPAVTQWTYEVTATHASGKDVSFEVRFHDVANPFDD